MSPCLVMVVELPLGGVEQPDGLRHRVVLRHEVDSGHVGGHPARLPRPCDAIPTLRHVTQVETLTCININH